MRPLKCVLLRIYSKADPKGDAALNEASTKHVAGGGLWNGFEDLDGDGAFVFLDRRQHSP